MKKDYHWDLLWSKAVQWQACTLQQQTLLYDWLIASEQKLPSTTERILESVAHIARQQGRAQVSN
jgi:hypothetical protein